MAQVQSFPPIAGPDARVLVLGSMPGVESLRQHRYYGHPRNAFWPILGRLFGFDPARAYDERVEALRTHRIALWDVLAHCVRPGSLDADIRDEVPNELGSFLTERPTIHTIAFNGQKAAAAFRKHVATRAPDEVARRRLETLPSTSPAHAGMTFEEKLRRWSVVRDAARGTTARSPDARRDGTRGARLSG